MSVPSTTRTTKVTRFLTSQAPIRSNPEPFSLFQHIFPAPSTADTSALLNWLLSKAKHYPSGRIRGKSST